MPDIVKAFIESTIYLVPRFPFMVAFMHYFLVGIMKVKTSIWTSAVACLSMYIVYSIIMRFYLFILMSYFRYARIEYYVGILAPVVLLILAAILFRKSYYLKAKEAIFAGLITMLADVGLRAFYHFSPWSESLEDLFYRITMK